MDLLSLSAELDNMAFNVQQQELAESEPKSETVKLWMRLFNYTSNEAIDNIKTWRSSFTRKRISNEHWTLVKADMEQQGYDKEAYEHELGLDRRQKRTQPSTAISISKSDARAEYLMKLSGPLSSAAAVQEAAHLPSTPKVLLGSGQDGDESFVKIDGVAKQAILLWLSQSSQSITFAPMFVRITKAHKVLDSNSLYPTLGIESTLPQFRATSAMQVFWPAQDQFPLWYFFYGTLSDKSVLAQLLGLQADDIELVQCKIEHARLGRWGDKYNALVDGDSCVDGVAYCVQSEAQEDALRYYETHMYEVVRCTLLMNGRTERGCVFRFVGDLD